MKKFLLIVASKDYQPIEYFVPRSLLMRNGAEVKTASDQKGEAHAAFDNTKTVADFSLEEVNVGDFDGIYFVGGSGALEHLDNEKSYKILRECKDLGKNFGSICISTRILAKAGVLTGKKATGWNGDGKLPDILDENGVEYVEEPVVADGKIITAEGPSAAYEFGKEILDNLSGKKA